MGKSGVAMAERMLSDERQAERRGLSVKDVKAGKVSLSPDEIAAKRETLGKCINPATGEPVSARREDTAVLPAPGTVQGSEDGNGTGTCGECGAHVKLSGKGFLTAHTVRRMSIPAPKARLAERMPTVTESGARTGSADASERARTAELSGVAGTDTVPVVVVIDGDTVKAKVPNLSTGTVELVMVDGVTVDGVDMGERKSRLVQVPNTVDNIRTAIRQESRKKLRPEYVKGDKPGERGAPTGRMLGGPDAVKLARLNRMLKGATGLESVGVLGAEPGCYRVREAVQVDAASVDVTGGTGSARDERGVSVRGHKLNARVPSSPGTALVPGRSELPIAGEVSVRRVGDPVTDPAPVDLSGERVTGKGKPRNAIGWSEPVGRERPDRVVIAGGDASVCNGRKGKPCTVVGCVAIVGAQYGYMACHVFRAQSKTAQRRYWGHVAVNESRDQMARERAGRERVVSRHPQHVTGKRVGVDMGVRQVSG